MCVIFVHIIVQLFNGKIFVNHAVLVFYFDWTTLCSRDILEPGIPYLHFFSSLTDSDFWFTKIVWFYRIWLVVNILWDALYSLHNHKFALATTSAINLRLFINHRRGKSKDRRKTMQNWLITIQATFYART